MKILGVRYGHDASAALIIDGKIIADVAEERFSRIKNDTSFPIKAIEYCLEEGKISSEELDILAISSDNFPPIFKVFFEFPETVLQKIEPKGINKLKKRIEVFLKGGSFLPVLPLYQKPFRLSEKCNIYLCEHHLAHAASAYYTSGLKNEKVLIATMDGRGDLVSNAIWIGENNKISLLKKWDGESSIGWFYANVTEALMWRQSSDEWKVMGLAPYGKRQKGLFDGFHPVFKDGELVKAHNYGSFGRWTDHGANHYHGSDSNALHKIAQTINAEDFAAEAQEVVEEQMFNLILPWLEKTGIKHLCCAGGCFLNVKFNQNLWYRNVLETQWVYPNPGDSGLAVGAALSAHFNYFPDAGHVLLQHTYYGPEFSNETIKEILDSRLINSKYYENIEAETAKHLSENKVVAWFQGRMEAGPRALGNRSILMSPLKAENKDIINAKVKYREKFRPFCPSVHYDKAKNYLENSRDELFMVTSFNARDEKKHLIPAVVHKDGTSRPQMVKKEVNERYYNLIDEFGKITGEYIILNTSFNIKGEPIVSNPREAIKCFYDTGIDVLVLGNYLIEKEISSKY